jgi:hypothetical protein
VSPWKVILATLVIFITGLITGAVLVKQGGRPTFSGRPTNATDPLLPIIFREEFVRRMEQELELTPEQRVKINEIVHESQERTRLLYGLIGDDVREEMRHTRESIREQLNPQQTKKFEEMQHRRAARRATADGSARGEAGDGTQPRLGNQNPSSRNTN